MSKRTSAKAKSPKADPRRQDCEWEVAVIRAKGERLGRVSAPDIEKAYDKAIQESGYRGDRKRLIAWRVG